MSHTPHGPDGGAQVIAYLIVALSGAIAGSLLTLLLQAVL